MFDFSNLSLPINVAFFSGGALLVWLAGTKLSKYVDLFADRTGMGKAFAGAMLLGGATSLPELATTLTASYSGAAEMAGTNLLGGVVMQLAVLAVIDAFVLRGRPLTLFSPQSSLLMVGVMLIVLVALASASVNSGELFSIGGIGFWPVGLFNGPWARLHWCDVGCVGDQLAGSQHDVFGGSLRCLQHGGSEHPGDEQFGDRIVLACRAGIPRRSDFRRDAAIGSLSRRDGSCRDKFVFVGHSRATGQDGVGDGLRLDGGIDRLRRRFGNLLDAVAKFGWHICCTAWTF